ncbi:MAG: T9SS type A sorting domain-containing protein [Bacteroidota bacterium]
MCFLLTNFLQAQDYQPLLVEGRTWDVYRWSSFCFYNPCSGGREYISGDSIIEGITYKKVYSKRFTSDSPEGFLIPPLSVSSDSFLVAFMREDTLEKKVYARELYTSFEESEYLAYDFSLAIGDTLSLDYLGDIKLVLDTMFNETIADGTTRKKWAFSDSNDFFGYLDEENYYIEGIGGTGSLLYPFLHNFEAGAFTSCVIENGEKLYDFAEGRSEYSCDAIVFTQKLSIENNITFFPNPVQNTLTIKSQQLLNAKLYDLSGTLLIESNINIGDNQINTENLPSAIYFLAFYDQNGYVGARKILKQ